MGTVLDGLQATLAAQALHDVAEQRHRAGLILHLNPHVMLLLDNGHILTDNGNVLLLLLNDCNLLLGVHWHGNLKWCSNLHRRIRLHSNRLRLHSYGLLT